MPDFLLLHLKKFTLRADWTSVKLDVSVDCPDIIDLGHLRASGKQPNEELLPEVEEDTPKAPPIDPVVLEQLVQMGFPLESCKKAIFHTKNSGIESATQWMMEHITDSDFSDPFVMPGAASKDTGVFVPDPNGLEMLMGMGFTTKQASKALQETQNNVERAADWIFSHNDELDALEMDIGSDQPASTKPGNRDGESG